MRFRKLPVVIEAEQYQSGKQIEGVIMKQPVIGGRGHGAIICPPQPYIETLEGDMAVSPGDWVITGVKGEKYPCKDEIFRATYEPADDDSFGWTSHGAEETELLPEEYRDRPRLDEHNGESPRPSRRPWGHPPGSLHIDAIKGG